MIKVATTVPATKAARTMMALAIKVEDMVLANKAEDTALAIRAEDTAAPVARVKMIPTVLAIKAEDRMVQAETNHTGPEIKAVDLVDRMAPVEEAILRTAREIHPPARAVRLVLDTATSAEVLPMTRMGVDCSKVAAKDVVTRVNPISTPPEDKVVTPTVLAMILALLDMVVLEVVPPTTHMAVVAREVVRAAREVMEVVVNRDMGAVVSKADRGMVDREAMTPTTKYGGLSCISIF